jgi:hypothetical protein
MHKQRPSPDRPARRPWLAAAVLLAVLPGVVAAIILARGQGDPAGLPEPADQAEPLVAEVAIQPEYAAGEPPGQFGALAALLPRPADDSTFRISTAARQWPANRMYEKIDGEDIVYLDAGCLGLAAMSLSNGSGMETIDTFLYRMVSAAAAKEVFDQQAPEADGTGAGERPKWLKLGDQAYTWYGSCYVRAGEYYLKIIVSGESAARNQAARLARQFVESLSGGPAGGTTKGAS